MPWQLRSQMLAEKVGITKRHHKLSTGSWVTAALLTIALLSGCGATRPSRYYELTVPPEPAPTTHPDAVPVTLLVGMLMTSHLYREDRIVFGSGPEEMGTYEYQRWAEPPAEMIQEILLRELRTTGHYRTVQTWRSNVRGDYVIRGRLYDFKEVTGNPVSARVTFDLEMRDQKSGATVWTHFYSHDQPASRKDVEGIVAALDQNVQEAIKGVVASLEQYFNSHPVANPGK